MTLTGTGRALDTAPHAATLSAYNGRQDLIRDPISRARANAGRTI